MQFIVSDLDIVLISSVAIIWLCEQRPINTPIFPLLFCLGKATNYFLISTLWSGLHRGNDTGWGNLLQADRNSWDWQLFNNIQKIFVTEAHD